MAKAMRRGAYVCRHSLATGVEMSQVPTVEVHEAHFSFKGRGFVVRRETFVFCVVRRE
jgi:hypothetical protein